MYEVWADSPWPEDWDKDGEEGRYRVGRYHTRKKAEKAIERMKVLRGPEIKKVES